MNEIIALNNTAIAYLQIGNVREACNTMTEASNAFLRATSNNRDSDNKRRRRRHRDTTITWTKIRSRCDRIDGKATSQEAAEKSGDSYSCDYDERDDCCVDIGGGGRSPAIYPYAPTLLKPCCQTEFCGDSKFCCEKCRDDTDVCPSNIAPVLRYNVALCCQLLGSSLLADGTRDRKEGLYYFDQATRLYEKVYGSCGGDSTGQRQLRSQQQQQQQPQSPGLLTMKMAIINNQAGIYYERGQPEACAKIMRTLSDTLASVPRSFLCGRWGVFRLNVMVLDALSARPPAPAA